MNREKVQTLINQIIEENHKQIGYKAARKQYAAAKWQIEKLTELGIIDMMPKGYGHSDAKAVINEAIDGEKTFTTLDGEGEKVPASPLYKAIREVEEVKTEVYTNGTSECYVVATETDAKVIVDGQPIEMTDDLREGMEFNLSRFNDETRILHFVFVDDIAIGFDKQGKMKSQCNLAERRASALLNCFLSFRLRDKVNPNWYHKQIAAEKKASRSQMMERLRKGQID